MLSIFALLAVLGDHLALTDTDGTFDWVQQLTFGSKLLPVLFIGGVVLAVVLDQRRLNAATARDHLFPTDHQFLASNRNGDPDLYATILVGRYRRKRNGVHTTADATAMRWPPLSQAADAPVAELARLARAAGVGAGPGSLEIGWGVDPEAADNSCADPRAWEYDATSWSGEPGFLETVGRVMQLGAASKKWLPHMKSNLSGLADSLD